RGEGVHEVESLAVREALHERVGLGPRDLVPSHVWDLHVAGQLPAPSGDESKAGRVVLLAPLEEDLHPQADAEHCPSTCAEAPDGGVEPGGLDGAHAGAEMSDAGD